MVKSSQDADHLGQKLSMVKSSQDADLVAIYRRLVLLPAISAVKVTCWHIAHLTLPAVLGNISSVLQHPHRR